MVAAFSSRRASISPCCFGSCAALSSYDPVADRRAGMACDRRPRHAQGLCEPVITGAAGSASRSLERPLVLLPWSARQSVEGDLARRPGRVPVHETPGARSLSVAEPGRWRGGDLAGATRLPV